MVNKRIHKIKNKNVLILGGLGLIGYEISKKFLENDYTVTILDQNLNLKKKIYLEKNFNTKFKIVKFQINDNNYKNIEKNFFKNNNILVNTLYVDDKKLNSKNIYHVSEKDLLGSIAKNIKYTMILSLNFAKYLKRNKKSGSIINFGSIYSNVAQDPNLYIGTKIKENIAYGFFKSGIKNFNKQLCATFSRYKIRSNLICPGGVRDKKNNLQNITFLKNYTKRVPIGRLAESKEIASVAFFLGSEESSYISGASIVVDGGWTSI